jgi:putative CocE/NonD family hydrolase
VRESASLRAAAKAARTGDVASSYLVWSRPVTDDVRVTGTPSVDLTVSQTGNVQVKLWDVAPDGSAVMFDENVALLTKGARVSFDLKSTDWTLAAGHQLAVEVGTIRSGSWRDQPTGNTVRVTGALLRLDLENPDGDVVTEGARSPYLDTYLRRNTTTVAEFGAGSFTLVPGRL